MTEYQIRNRFIPFGKADIIEMCINDSRLSKQDYFKDKRQKNLYFTPGSTIIKPFQNVPKADLEMLFPNGEVRMKTIDKLIIGVPAAVSGIILTATKLGGTIF